MLDAERWMTALRNSPFRPRAQPVPSVSYAVCSWPQTTPGRWHRKAWPLLPLQVW